MNPGLGAQDIAPPCVQTKAPGHEEHVRKGGPDAADRSGCQRRGVEMPKHDAFQGIRGMGLEDGPLPAPKASEP